MKERTTAAVAGAICALTHGRRVSPVVSSLVSDGVLNELGAVRTLAELFAWRVNQSRDALAYLAFDARAQDWSAVTWQQIGARVARFALAMEALRLHRGARVAILLPNGLDAVSVDQAALALACVPVPMHAFDNPESIAFILADSDASLLVAQSEAQWHAIAATGLVLPFLRHVVIADGAPLTAQATAKRSVMPLEDWLAEAATDQPGRHTGPRHDDLAALVYTSGTTGKPKGVMLSHDNVLDNVKATMLCSMAPARPWVNLWMSPLASLSV